MKVRQMRENIDINGKDIYTNEQTDERMEQKFQNKISKTREIEENPFFKHDNRLFQQFVQNIWNCHQQYFV